MGSPAGTTAPPARRWFVVGTPNVGKTSLVNAVAHTALQVGNWAGTTGEVVTARAALPCGDVVLVDLPGAYGLAGSAPDERVVLPTLDADPEGLIVNVVDATHLARDLTLSLELAELGRPMIVALNLVRQAAAGGAEIDPGRLGRALGVEVVTVSAHGGSGSSDLVEAARRAARPTCSVAYHDAVEAAVGRLLLHAPTRWHALAALGGELAEPGAATLAAAAASERSLLEAPGADPYLAIAEARHRAAHALARAATTERPCRSHASDRIDGVLLHPLVGPVALVVGLALTFHLTFALSNPWVSFLATAQSVLAGWIAALALPPLVEAFIAGALVEGVGTVVAFVPVLFTLYAILGFLENAGALARVAYLADGLMRVVGLPGRAALPMVLSVGCTVPAVHATRMLDERDERLRLALALPSIPCGARLPVFVLITAAVVPAYPAVVVTGLYLLGFVVAAASALAFRHLLRTQASSGAMELPAYRLPPATLVLRLACSRTRAFLAGAGGPILIAVVAMWALLTIEGPGGVSLFEGLARSIAPLFAPLGLGDWRVVGALVSGAVAKEVVIGSLALTFVGGDATAPLGLSDGLATIGTALVAALRDTLTGIWGSALASEAPDGVLGSRLAGALTTGGALSLLVFTLLYVPCVATLATLGRAFGARYALLSAAHQVGVAYAAAWVVSRVWS